MPRAARSWVPDELAFAGRENLDPTHVGRYDAKEDGDAAAELALLQAAGLGPDATVVDLGAGTGQFTLAAAGAVERAGLSIEQADYGSDGIFARYRCVKPA